MVPLARVDRRKSNYPTTPAAGRGVPGAPCHPKAASARRGRLVLPPAARGEVRQFPAGCRRPSRWTERLPPDRADQTGPDPRDPRPAV